MSKISKNKPYDLEERIFQFAKNVRLFIKTLEKTIANIEDAKQVVRSSGSVGANYIEANESLSKKDFVFRIKISRKEAKKSVFWLRLIKKSTELKNLSSLKFENLILRFICDLLLVIWSLTQQSFPFTKSVERTIS
ncbi:MAG: four helix bundle protein [Cyclobacteriaceae bacterium]|nr:four helix bundle protein [Cyclobacteriaceae bacterium]